MLQKKLGLHLVAKSLVILAIDCGCAFSADADPVLTLLNTLSHLDHVEIRASAQSSASNAKLAREGDARKPGDASLGDYEYLFLRDDGRCMLSEVYHRDKQGRPLFSKTERILKSGEMLFVSDRLDEKLAQTMSDNDFMMSFASEHIAGAKARRNINDLMEGLNDFAIVFGYLGYFPVKDYFGSSAKVTVLSEGEFIKVEAHSGLGRLALWLDPAFGNLPHKLELVKQQHDLTSSGRRVSEIDMRGDGKVWPSGRIKQLVWSADDITLAQSGSVSYIQGVDLVQRVVSVAGPTVTIHTRASVSQIDFNPSFDDTNFSPSLKVPKDYPVTIEEAEHLPYVWNGDRVVPSSTEGLGALSTQSVYSGKRITLILLNVALIVLLLATLVLRKRAAAK